MQVYYLFTNKATEHQTIKLDRKVCKYVIILILCSFLRCSVFLRLCLVRRRFVFHYSIHLCVASLQYKIDKFVLVDPFNQFFNGENTILITVLCRLSRNECQQLMIQDKKATHRIVYLPFHWQSPWPLLAISAF